MLTDIGGWARQFLHAGAAAFNGAYWSIYDQPIFDFARDSIVACSEDYRLAERFSRHVLRSNLQATLRGWLTQCLLIRWRRYERGLNSTVME